MTTTLQVRTNPKLKESAQTVLKELGLDLSTAINMYLVQIVRRRGIPFQVLTENGMTPAAEKRILNAMKEARNSKKMYHDVDEMFRDILGE